MGVFSGRSIIPSCSSEIFISRSESSIPFDVTPRISVGFRVMPVPGIYEPPGANTPIMPVRAFGAPQTSSTVSPFPGSTVHTRSLSAFGCCVASRTFAVTKVSKPLARSSTPSSSRPTIVSASVISLRDAVVSRCSLSQLNVNFIG